MTPEELDRWANVLDRAIRGEWVTLVYETWEEATHAFGQCRDIMRAIGLVHDASRRQARCFLRIDELGGIRFTTFGLECLQEGVRSR